ncbi:MAG: hypothetical protein IR153_07045 [Flavobacterium sp.]|nr:hypothetical protein [Flavobacterium sp.]
MFSLFQSYSQEITGTVISDNGVLPNARVTAKKKSQILSFAFTNVKGEFTLPDLQTDSVNIEVTHLNFDTKLIRVVLPLSDPLLITLVEKPTSLSEVVIVNDRPMTQKKDTVIYKIDHFKDGTERVVEDILKKLPGINVTEAGKIFYKGKEIKSLMIDGDDLFSSQYTIGSKNIDVNDVESVEAIENFNKNKILHKLSESNNVALNLNLKNGRPAISARATLENNFYSKYNNGLTSLLLHQKIKGFSTIQFNNIGNSLIPDFYFDGVGADKLEKSRDLISNGAFPTFLGNRNSLLNNTFSTNESIKVNLVKTVSSTFGINYFQDKISQDLKSRSDYSFQDQYLTYRNIDRQIQKPQVFSISNENEFYNSENLQVNSVFLLEKRSVSYENNGINNDVFRRSQVGSDSYFIGGKITATKLISSKSALNAEMLFSESQSDQLLSLSPEIELEPGISAKEQTSIISSSYVAGQIKYVTKWKKFNFEIANSSRVQNDHLKSKLDSINGLDHQNDLAFESFTNSFTSQAKFQFRKFNFRLSHELTYNQINNALSDFENLFNAGIRYSINRKQRIELQFFQRLENPALQNVFTSPILTSDRTSTQNQGLINNIKSTDASLVYTISDTYNTFFLRTAVTFSSRNRDYYQTTQLSPVIIRTNSILLDYGNNRAGANLSVHKLIPGLKINVKYNVNYTFLKFYNYIEDSPLRTINSSLLNNELELYKTIKSFSLKNTLNVDYRMYKVEGRTNSFAQIKNEFSVNVKLSELLSMQSNIKTFLPDNQSRFHYNFLDFEVLYNLKSLKTEFYLRGQNLLNHKTFRNVSVSDFERSSFSYKLQERTILLGMMFKLF